MSAADNEALRRALEVLLIRLRIGHTLRRAVEGLPPLRSNKVAQKSWERLFHAIEEGRLSAEKSVHGFLKDLEIQDRIRGLIREKLYMPRLQSKLIAILCGLLMLALSVFMRAELGLEARGTSAMGALTLVFLSFVTTEILLKRAQRPWIFFVSWISFLSALKSLLEWGQTLGPALEQALASHPLREAPANVTTRLEQLRQLSVQGLEVETQAPERAPTKARSWEFEGALEHLKWIEQLYNQGEPLTPLLEALMPSLFEAFERHIKCEAEKLGMRALVPLFIFNIPAFFWMLLSPLYGLLAHF
jgi:hypothetical protein